MWLDRDILSDEVAENGLTQQIPVAAGLRRFFLDLHETVREVLLVDHILNKCYF